jgi:osmotically-inducible protein OsmY
VSLLRQANDGYVSTKVKGSLIEIGGVAANHVKVATEDGVVYLMGLVTRAEADRAAAVAARVSGVRKVVTLWELISERDAFRPEPSPAPWSAPGAGK